MKRKFIYAMAAFATAVSLAIEPGMTAAQILRPRAKDDKPASGPAVQVVPAQPTPPPQTPAPPATAPIPRQGSAVIQGQVETQISGQPGAAAPSPQPPAGPVGVAQDVRIVRGSTLIGTTVFDAQNQQLAVIRDLLVDPRTGAVNFIVLEIQAADAGGRLVVVPFDVMRVTMGAEQRHHVVLMMQPTLLLRAPAIEANQWTVIHDPQFISRVTQFYRSVERVGSRSGAAGVPSGAIRSDVQGEFRTGRTRSGEIQGDIRGEGRTDAPPRADSQMDDRQAPGANRIDTPNAPGASPAPTDNRPPANRPPANRPPTERPSADRPSASQNDASQSNDQSGSEQPRSGQSQPGSAPTKAGESRQGGQSERNPADNPPPQSQDNSKRQ